MVADLGNVTASTLNVHINSPGGDVFDGIAILNALRNFGKTKTVNTIVDGLAASAASFIAQAGSKRTMSKNSEMMIHNASGLVIGQASDMREMADMLERVGTNIASVYAERAGGDVADWLTAMQAETWYSAQEAVDAGLADEVDGEEKAENVFDLSIFAFSGRTEAPSPVKIVPHETEFTFNPESFRAAFAKGNVRA